MAVDNNQMLGMPPVVSNHLAYHTTASLTPSTVLSATSNEQTFTVNGLLTTDAVFVNGPAPVAGTGIGNARVSAANTLAITFVNCSTSAKLVPTAGTYHIVRVRDQ